jgi:sugar fermentation stimulation protein A
MRFPPLVRATFLARPNRFRAEIMVEGVRAAAHVASPGRMTELLLPGRTVWVTPAAAAHRVTDYDLKLVEHDGVLVSVDSRLPNALFAEALAAGRILADGGYTRLESEVVLGRSRLDFCLSGDSGICWVECKSVNLVVEDGLALFPDAPTVRGRKHLLELIAAVDAGQCALAAFIIQRDDVESFAPHAEADPAFAAALCEAQHRGVDIKAWTCRVDLHEIVLERQVPLCLGAMPKGGP